MPTLGGPPLIETKLRPPAGRAGLVPRAELVERLAAAVESHPLTVVSAAAGWGKTTLVGEWLRASGHQVAWVALDASDDDPARFWSYLTEALARAGIELDTQAVGALAGADATREAGLSELINAAAAASGRTVIALDDLHAVSEPTIMESLAFLVARLPETLRVIVTTRTDPPIGLARLRARGELAEIRADDLRFGPDEAGRLLSAAIGADLPAGEVERLRARTEGWAAGLYLAGLSLRGRDDPAAFIADFAGDDRLVVDYLAAEVLEAQPPDRRAFMLRTAVLGRLTGPLCDAVLDAHGSSAVLAELERSNLFIVPLDRRRGWYRYHHLFGELLRHELNLEDPGIVPDLHRRAADWFLAAGDVDDAITHFAAAGDLDRAGDLIAASWAGLERSGWTATTQRWMALLPPERVRSDPRLSLAEAFIAINLGRPDAATPWLDAAERGAAEHPEVAAEVLSGRSLVHQLSGRSAEAAEAAREAVRISAGGPAWARAVACLSLGISLHALDRLDEAGPWLEEVVALAPSPGARAGAVVALGHLAARDVDAGEYARAERRALEAIEMAREERHAEYPHAAGAHAALAQARARRGDQAAALEEADRAVDLARRGHSRPEIAHAVVARADVRALGGDADGARADLEEARAILSGVPAVHLRRCVRGVEARLADERRAPEAATAAAPDHAGPLTDRELAVLRRLTGGGSAREIARDLYVSHNTIKTQIRAIYRKLGVASREDAVARARERGILPRPLRG